MKLKVVIPTLNEAGNLSFLIDRLFALELPEVDLSVLIIDDNSDDGTKKIADRFAKDKAGLIAVVSRNGERSFSSACIEGFTLAIKLGADLVVQMDGDGSHDPVYLPEMIDKIQKAEVVIGSRYIKGGSIDPNWNKVRKLLSWMANKVVVPKILRIPVKDVTSGYRLWRKEALSRVINLSENMSSSYGVQVQLIHTANDLGFRIKEIPIHFAERKAGRSKMSLVVKLKTIRDVLLLGFKKST